MNSALKQRVLATALAATIGSGAVLGTGGYNLISHSEGNVYHVYKDPVGIATVCRGHTDPNLRLDMVFTANECDILFRADVAKAQRAIKSCTTKELTGNQMDAVTSLTINIGGGAYCHSSVVRYINQGNYPVAATQFAKWNKAGSRVLPGLVIRRANEARLFQSRYVWTAYNINSLATQGAAKAND